METRDLDLIVPMEGLVGDGVPLIRVTCRISLWSCTTCLLGQTSLAPRSLYEHPQWKYADQVSLSVAAINSK
jgi:hypothetical protein